MYHPPLDGAGADQGHADDDIFKALGLEFGQHLRLGAALDLEAADRIGPLQQIVDGGVVQRQIGRLELDAPLRLDMAHGLLDHAQRAQREEVDLDQPGIFDTVLVPLHHNPARHRRPLQRHHLDQRRGGDDHAPHVDGEVARDAVHLPQEIG